jgi:hypothetical protein
MPDPSGPWSGRAQPRHRRQLLRCRSAVGRQRQVGADRPRAHCPASGRAGSARRRPTRRGCRRGLRPAPFDLAIGERVAGRDPIVTAELLKEVEVSGDGAVGPGRGQTGHVGDAVTYHPLRSGRERGGVPRAQTGAVDQFDQSGLGRCIGHVEFSYGRRLPSERSRRQARSGPGTTWPMPHHG